jgi:hypothetical protein
MIWWHVVAMGEIVNLRKARKAQARLKAAAQAAGNRARHGRTAEERERERLEAEQARRRLDGAKQDDR